MLIQLFMPLLKDDKKDLAQKYVEMMEAGKNVVVIKHTWIPVNEINEMRMWVSEAEGKVRIVKKRVLLKGLEGKYDGLSLDMLEWSSIALLTSTNEDDEHAPLKAINKLNKKWKKDKAEFGVEFIWGWYEGAEWRDGAYVSELANLPSKEELIGKFLFMLNHPVSSFARVLKAIADDQWWGEKEKVEEAALVDEATSEEPKAEEEKQEEQAEEKQEEAQEEQTEEKQQEEAQEEQAEESTE